MDTESGSMVLHEVLSLWAGMWNSAWAGGGGSLPPGASKQRAQDSHVDSLDFRPCSLGSGVSPKTAEAAGPQAWMTAAPQGAGLETRSPRERLFRLESEVTAIANHRELCGFESYANLQPGLEADAGGSQVQA